jgi:predicted metal-dependent phosphoesterase TrpH
MRYDLHTHTKYSICSNMGIETLLATAKKRGLDGIAITDHNNNKAALLAKKMNKDKDFEVIVGEEVSTDLGDVLIYHAEKFIRPGNFFDVIDQARKQDAIISIAHPFRFFPLHGFKGNLRDVMGKVDAIESLNGRTPFISNIIAEKKADGLNIAKTAGSDAHFSFEVGRCATIFDGDLRKELKHGRTKVEGTTFFGPFGHLCTFNRKYIR